MYIPVHVPYTVHSTVQYTVLCGTVRNKGHKSKAFFKDVCEPPFCSNVILGIPKGSVRLHSSNTPSVRRTHALFGEGAKIAIFTARAQIFTGPGTRSDASNCNSTQRTYSDKGTAILALGCKGALVAE